MIDAPISVMKIIETLEQAGFEAYAVGGCVRDSLLGRNPSDWDITTSARPEQVKALFSHTIDTGIRHGTVTVMLEHVGYEVTTYRIDGEYEDSRHPKEVIFTPLLTEDLKRRDFTINAMAWNPRAGIIDEFGGMEDLDEGIIRCVGSPEERFSEDALRMMRAVRFSAQLGYEIEPATKAAIRKLAPNLTHVSAERIQVELVKLVESMHPDYLRVAYETGITRVVLPEFDLCMETEQHNPHHCYTVGEHMLHSMLAISSNRYLRLAMLLHDIAKPEKKKTDEQGIDHFHGHQEASEEMAKVILRRLKFDNETIRIVSRLIGFHDYRFPAERRSVRRAVWKVGEDLFPMLLQVKEADTMAQSLYERAEKLEWIAKVEKLYREILKDRECLSLKDLAVTGRDLIRAGCAPGPELGRILNEMLQDVLEHPEHNNKEYLLQSIRQ